MDAIFARLSQLEDRAREQEATNARLSSENKELKTLVGDQGRVIADLSTLTAPDGFWVWESSLVGDGQVDAGGRSMGRWVWSLEKFAPAPNAAATASGASLLSLPVELLQAVVAFLDEPDQLTLLQVCFRLLEVTSPLVFSFEYTQCMPLEDLITYIEPRVSPDLPKSRRLSPLLDVPAIRCCNIPRQGVVSAKLDTLPTPHITVDITSLEIVVDEDYPDQLHRWSILLRFFNPEKVAFRSGGDPPFGTRPTIFRVPSAPLASLSSSWTRLKLVSCYGPGSVPLLVVTSDRPSPSTLALARGGEGPQYKDTSRVYAIEYGVVVDGKVSGPSIPEDKIVETLERPWQGIPGRLGLYFYLHGSVKDKDAD